MVSKGPATDDLRTEANGKATTVAAMVEEIVGCKWSVQLLWHILDGHHRPSELLRELPGLSPKVMHQRLRKMVGFGILQRSVRGEKPPVEVEYLLTPFGQRFMRVLDEVRRLQEAVDAGAELRSVAVEAEVTRAGTPR